MSTRRGSLGSKWAECGLRHTLAYSSGVRGTRELASAAVPGRADPRWRWVPLSIFDIDAPISRSECQLTASNPIPIRSDPTCVYVRWKVVQHHHDVPARGSLGPPYRVRPSRVRSKNTLDGYAGSLLQARIGRWYSLIISQFIWSVERWMAGYEPARVAIGVRRASGSALSPPPLSLSFSLTHTHTHIRKRIHARKQGVGQVADVP